MAGDGCVNFVITITGDVDLGAELNELVAGLVADRHTKLVVVKEPDCCPRCAANDDPTPILRGGLHPRCRCSVIEVDDSGNSRLLN